MPGHEGKAPDRKRSRMQENKKRIEKEIAKKKKDWQVNILRKRYKKL